jgi:hypothetical protein
MDYVLRNIGENKVTQVIVPNEYEQTTDYKVVKLVDTNIYEDLLRKRIPNSTSMSSITSVRSSSDNLMNMNNYLYLQEDPFMYLMLYFILKIPR